MKSIRQLAAAWLPWTRRLFIPLALGFLLYSAYRASDRLLPLIAGVSTWHLLLAWLCWGAAQWIGPLSTVAFARMLDLPLGYNQLSLISVLRLPAKYLPGGIWQSVARFAAYRRHEVGKADSLTILVAEHLLALGVSAAMGSSLLLWLDIASLRGVAACVLAGAVALLAATTSWVVKVRGGGAKTLAAIGLAVLATTLFWTAAAASFCAYWSAVFAVRGDDLLRVASCYLLSWSAGFVAIFAPQGLGVFEWVAGHLLGSAQPLSVTVTAVAGFRLITMAGDLGAWSVGVALSRRRKGATA